MLHSVIPEQRLHSLFTGMSMENTIKTKKKKKNPTKNLKTRNGLIQMIRMDWSTGKKRGILNDSCV